MDVLFRIIIEFFGYALSELILSTFFFLCGWPVVKLCTLGRYPTHSRPDGSRQDVYVCCVGVAAFSLVLMVVLGQF